MTVSEVNYFYADGDSRRYILKDVATLVPDYYKVIASGSFDAVGVPMKSIRDMSSIILSVTVGAALVILSLLITLFLRDRKHEIGIYLSLGERKAKGDLFRSGLDGI